MLEVLVTKVISHIMTEKGYRSVRQKVLLNQTLFFRFIKKRNYEN